MKIKYLLFSISFLSLFDFLNVFGLEIKNIHIGSVASDRWIEIFNEGEDISDFTTTNYRLLDSTSESKRSIIEVGSNPSFPKDTTAYIYKTLSPSTKVSETLPEGASILFRSSFALDKDNGYILITNSTGSIIYSCKAYGSGTCPENITPPAPATSTTSSASSTETEKTEPKTVYIYVPTNNQQKYGDINVLLPEEKTVPALADVEYTVKAIDSQKRSIGALDFNWSFGDGGEKFGKDATYNYVYPGDYTLIVTADGFTSSAQAKMAVKVIAPNLKIIKVGGGGEENYIDIQNDTGYDLFLSNFYLNLDNNFFKLPKNLVIAKNKTVHISGEAVGFKLPAHNVSLNYPNKNLLTRYERVLDLATETLDILEKSKEISLNDSGISTSSDMATTNIFMNEFMVEAVTKPKITTLVNVEKRIKNTENVDKSSKKSEVPTLFLKKLVFNQKGTSLKTVENKAVYEGRGSDSENVKKKDQISEKSVDIGIIKWFKSLIY